MKRIFLLQMSLLAGIIFFACTSKDVDSKPLSTEIIVRETPTNIKESPETEWDEVLRKAKSEGRLSVAMWASAGVRDAVTRAFSDKYRIPVETIGGLGSELVERVLRETKAGILTVDMLISGTGTMVNVLKPANIMVPVEPELILPEVKDPKVWYHGYIYFVDPEKTMLPMMMYPGGGTAWINSELVKKDELKSARDYLNPKWTEKVVINDPMLPGPMDNMFSVIATGPLGWDYLRELVRLKPTIIRDRRLAFEWVARGKYPIGFTFGSDIANEFQQLGMPLERILFSEGQYLTDGATTIALFKDPPHPYARKLFLNWLLTQEGATVWSRADFKQSARVDTPTNHLPPYEIRQPEAKYLNSLTISWELERPQRLAKMKEVFAPLLR